MIRKVNGKKARQSRWIGQLLIVLALSSLGCARGDWTTETLTLADVTGTWEGMFILRGLSSGYERSTRWILQQNGQKVRGEVQGPDQAPIASIEGQLNGEIFDWHLTGPFVRVPELNTSSKSYRGAATVNSDEMSGRADGPLCPCTFLLRRVGSDTSGKKAQ